MTDSSQENSANPLAKNVSVIGGRPPLAHEESGYKKSLRPRQIQMIAIGGAIGTGLFMGAGSRLHNYGPALVLLYLIAGIFAFLILRALGELVLHRPSSGSFVSYAREFFGEKMAYFAGWMVFLNWALTSIVDTTAVALYFHFWGQYVPWIQATPTWLTALVALVVVLSINLLSVKAFGEMEFWFALIKVSALIIFLVVGVLFLIFGTPTDVGPTGVSVIADHGGFFPAGFAAPLVALGGVVFAYAAIELVGTAAGETKDPEKIMPRAVNSVIVRIAVFYVGAVLLLALLLPYNQYQSGVSPFVTFFAHAWGERAGIITGSIMNFVVLTAALSSLNAGLYSTGRVLRSMAENGSAPKFTAVMSKRGVPFGGILLTCVFTVVGVFLNWWLGATVAFEAVMEVASIGIIGGWATIVLCQLRFHQLVKRGVYQRPHFRMPFAPWSGYITLAFLLFVLVTMAFDPVSRWALACLVVVIPLLIAGWYWQRGRILEIARARAAYTGHFPVLPERPAWDYQHGTREEGETKKHEGTKHETKKHETKKHETKKHDGESS